MVIMGAVAILLLDKQVVHILTTHLRGECAHSDMQHPSTGEPLGKEFGDVFIGLLAFFSQGGILHFKDSLDTFRYRVHRDGRLYRAGNW